MSGGHTNAASRTLGFGILSAAGRSGRRCYDRPVGLDKCYASAASEENFEILAVDSQGIFHSEFGRSGRRCYDHPVGVQTPQQRPPGRSCIIKRTCKL